MLHPSVFPFLEELRDNNNRDWFKDNKHKHDAARAHVVQFTQALFERLSDVNQLDGQKVFRVYRDVRFSKNKTPYKSHFGIGFHRIKPQYRGGYYLHLEPGASFFGAGFWGPNKDDLFRVRKEIEMDPEYFEKMATAKKLTETWGAMKGDQLKTAPKGFDKEHPGIKTCGLSNISLPKKFRMRCFMIKISSNGWWIILMPYAHSWITWERCLPQTSTERHSSKSQ